MKCLFIVILSFVLVGASVKAAELTPLIRNGKLGVFLKDIKFPESLAKDLKSGLTSKIFIRFEFVFDSKTISHHLVDVGIKYDLWEENFRVETRLENGSPVLKKYASLAETVSSIENLKIADLVTLAAGNETKELLMKADILLNPIEKEKMEKIRSWVAQNSVPTQLDSSGVVLSRPVANSRSNEMFNKIYEQYLAGSNIAAWKESVKSRPYKLSEIPREK